MDDENKVPVPALTEEEKTPTWIVPASEKCDNCIKVKKQEAEIENAAKNNDHFRHLKDGAFKLLVWCMIAIFTLYVVDAILAALEKVRSENFNTILDYAKTVTTMLLGFLFGAKSKDT